MDEHPGGAINSLSNEFISYPEVTSILGAAKFSGKTKKGTAIGILESVTAEEQALMYLEGEERTTTVEPLSNYFVGRFSQDFNEGKSYVGLMLTNVSRRLSQNHLVDQFGNSALTGGLDFLHTWKDREWRIGGNLIFSSIKGSQSVITDLQTSFEHYFQRPDAEHLAVDHNATMLTGQGGNLYLANYGGKDRISFQGGVTWRDPKVDLNDMGFMNAADLIFHYFWAGFNYPKKVGILNNFRINYNHYFAWTYGGEHTFSAFNTNWHTQFVNQWRIGAGGTFNTKSFSTKALFGGPMLRLPLGTNSWMYMESDSRKKISFFMNLWKFFPSQEDSGARFEQGIFMRANWQPSNAINLSIGPNLTQQRKLIQNVSFDSFDGDPRYITGSIRQQTLSLQLRANVNLSPTLTIQYWGQPFISKGNYNDFKYITDSKATHIHDQYHQYSEDQIRYSELNQYLIDENRDGLVDYQFGNPNFNFMQFRSNLVMRWEYKTGSELFLVWSQSNRASGDSSEQLVPSLRNNLFANQPTNIFLLKMTYRFIK